MPRYSILTPQWDQFSVLHRKGAILEFEEGKQPKGAKLVPEEEPEEETEAEVVKTPAKSK